MSCHKKFEIFKNTANLPSDRRAAAVGKYAFLRKN